MASVSKRLWTDATGKAREAWRVSYTDQAGKRRFKQFTRKKDADAYALTAQWEVRQGIHTVDADSVTVGAAADIWLTSCEANGCDRGTMKSYREVVRLHIKPLIGGEKLSRLAAPKVVEFRDAMLLTRSHAMATKAVRHLSMILSDAQSRGLVAQNVARGVKVKRPRDEAYRTAKRAEIPPKVDLKALIEAADRLDNADPRLPALVRVAMFVGPRQSELRALRWSDADFGKATLTISRRADRWGGINVPKSAAGNRTVPIGPTLVAILRKWKLRCPPSDQDLMFPNTRGGVVDQKRMADIFLTTQVEAGLAIDTGKREGGAAVWKARYGWHDLRHAAASAWISQGVDLKRLQVWIGHANIQLTLDVYGHLIKDAERDATLAAGAEAALLA